MMSKLQKIWLCVSGALFVIPEILWTPLGNFYYEFLQSSVTGSVHPLRDNILQKSDNINYLKLVIFLQFIGLLSILIITVKNINHKGMAWKYLVILLLSVILVITGFALYFALSFNVALV